jgi:sugar-specific transcriptional regulator TrmB
LWLSHLKPKKTYDPKQIITQDLNVFSDGKIIETLSQLGLTVPEAKIYLALCKHQSLTTKTISKLTTISQPDTYRVLAQLQQKGLIEKLIERPSRFKILPIDESLSYLLKTKKAQYCELEANTESLFRTLEEKIAEEAHETIDSQFILIPQRDAVVKRIRNAIEKAEKSVDLYLSWKRFTQGITSAFAESSAKAWAKGVKFRIIVESPEKEDVLKQALQFGEKSPFCEIRFFPRHPKTVIGLYDRKDAFIILNPKEALLESPALWTDNQSLISVIQDYFEILWLTAVEKPILSKYGSEPAT